MPSGISLGGFIQAETVLGHHSQNLYHNWYSEVGPAGTPPNSQATTVQEMRTLPKNTDKLPASEHQKTKYLIFNICVHCEEIYNEKKRGSHTNMSGLISLKVIYFMAAKESQDTL